MADCRMAMPAFPAAAGAMPAFPTTGGAAGVQQPTSGQQHHQHMRGLFAKRGAFSHGLLFVPKERHGDGWQPQLRGSQFPRDCKHHLLVEDDMTRSGLGFTARLLSSALLLAARLRRVLIEVPQRNTTTGALVGRWCNRPPHTLQCLFEPWSDCEVPPARTTVLFEDECRCILHYHWRNRTANCTGHVDFPGDRIACLVGLQAPSVRIRLSSIFRLQGLWVGPGPDAFGPLRAAHRLLFSPRQWVRELSACVMRQHGLSAGRYLTVHIRLSPEKQHEVGRGGKRLPNVREYTRLTQLAVHATGLRDVFVSTAHPHALDEFVAWAREQNLSVSYTQNPRSETDAWGGWSSDEEGTAIQSATAAVNYYLSSHAAMLISPSLSIWTPFLVHAMGYDAHAPPETAPRVAGGTNSSLPHISPDVAEFSFLCSKSARGASYLRVVAPFAAVNWSAVDRMWKASDDFACTGKSRSH